MSSTKQTEGVGAVFIIGAIIAIAFGYQQLDSAGWIPHEVDSAITAESNWLVGETKECTSLTVDAATAKSKDEETWSAVDSLVCDNGPIHKIKITFYGRTAQPEYLYAHWKCTRISDSFTCRETGGEGTPRSDAASETAPISKPAPVFGNCESGPCHAGDTRAFDNVLYVWDGSKWLPKD